MVDRAATSADVNSSVNKDGATPLHMAAHLGLPDVLSALLAKNANVKAVDKTSP
eukprot:gene30478-35493_t